MQTAKISEEVAQEILHAAEEVGLFANNVDYDWPRITDMAATAILINANGTSYHAHVITHRR